MMSPRRARLHFDLSPESRQPPGASNIEMVCGRCPKSTHRMNDSGYFVLAGDDESGGSMSRAERDEAIIAFLLFCLEMYQTEQQRKRKMH
jgi:hypothetical protein